MHMVQTSILVQFLIGIPLTIGSGLINVSSSYRLLVTSFPDDAHDRYQKSVNTLDQNTLTMV